MHAHADNPTAPPITKVDPTEPALVVTTPTTVAIRAGTVFNGHTFAEDTAVLVPGSGYRVGSDYVVAMSADVGGPHIREARGAADCAVAEVLGGFHFAPGGNAAGRSGGDERPAINPYSLWDRRFRPACPDPRGMALIGGPDRRFWCDIYLLGVEHLANGTSRFGATIADGESPPEKPDGGSFRKLDYETAVAAMAHHGKGLLGVEEFFAAAYGVTEKTAAAGDPRTTKLDAPRTSRFGLMQATGNMWVWGHDGDPDLPRASFFGGSWWFDGAGSRRASVAYDWPGDSNGGIGARGRSDHLQPE